MIMKEEDAQRHLLQDRAQEEAEKKAKEEAEERDYIRFLKVSSFRNALDPAILRQAAC